MRYSQNVDLLLPAIIYLGTHEFYWARSSKHMARELALNPARLDAMFRGFPGLFRKTVAKDDPGTVFYALQARYAQREGGDTDDVTKVSWIRPLDREHIQMLIEFVSHQAEQERAGVRAWISVVAAIVAASAAIAAAFIRGG